MDMHFRGMEIHSMLKWLHYNGANWQVFISDLTCIFLYIIEYARHIMY